MFSDKLSVKAANEYSPFFPVTLSEFNMFQETITIDKFNIGDEVDFMDLFISKGEKFQSEGIFDVSIFH